MSGSTEAARLLSAHRQPDGGFGPSPSAASEPEPTALAALALDDARARAWLLDQQRDDGSWLVGPASVGNDSATPLAALAVDGDARQRAIDHVVANRAVQVGNYDLVPHDADTRGWSWTPTIFGWVEPTARATLMLKLLRPEATEIGDGLAVLADRECVGGGWNYGNRRVRDVDLPPFLQTSAAGLMAVHDGPADLRERGVAATERLWRDQQGGLGWAMGLVALQLAGAATEHHAGELSRLVTNTSLLDDTVALAWATLALGGGWEQLRVRR